VATNLPETMFGIKKSLTQSFHCHVMPPKFSVRQQCPSDITTPSRASCHPSRATVIQNGLGELIEFTRRPWQQLPALPYYSLCCLSTVLMVNIGLPAILPVHNVCANVETVANASLKASDHIYRNELLALNS